ncbi:MAG: hypothetical protein WAM92_10095 [Mycobacterium sp.]
MAVRAGSRRRGKLDHPNIVSVYNRGETGDGQLWIAMQFVDSTDADAALRDGTMTAVRAVPGHRRRHRKGRRPPTFLRRRCGRSC